MSDQTHTTQSGLKLKLREIRGKLYMDCIERVRWMRTEKPDWAIQTELVSATQDGVLFKASVVSADGRLLATAHRYQDRKGFAQAGEKAETQAIGRALALVGYGTSFAEPDFEEGDDPSGLADSAVDKKANAPTECVRTDVPPGVDLTTPENFVVTFGKFKGMKLKDVGLDDALNYASWLVNNAQQTNKPINPAARVFVDMVELYKNTSETFEQDVP